MIRDLLWWLALGSIVSAVFTDALAGGGVALVPAIVAGVFTVAAIVADPRGLESDGKEW